MTNMGWTLGCPGQAGKIVKELRCRSRGCSGTAGSVGIGSADEIGKVGRIGSADFSTNMGWTLDWPGHAGKFIEGTR